jgi:hypothetical protein
MVENCTHMQQSLASRIDVHNAGVTSRQKPVDFVALTRCAELKDGSVVVDKLYHVNESSTMMACKSIRRSALEPLTLGNLVFLEIRTLLTRIEVVSIVFRDL